MSLFSVNAVMDRKRRDVKGEQIFSARRRRVDYCVHKQGQSVFIPIIEGKPCIHVDCDCLALYFLM